MSWLTLVGWLLFRAPSLSWLAGAITDAELGISGDSLLVAAFTVGFVLAHVVPWGVAHWLQRQRPDALWGHAMCRCALLALVVILGRETPSDFIYFQF